MNPIQVYNKSNLSLIPFNSILNFSYPISNLFSIVSSAFFQVAIHKYTLKMCYKMICWLYTILYFITLCVVCKLSWFSIEVLNYIRNVINYHHPIKCISSASSKFVRSTEHFGCNWRHLSNQTGLN